MEQFQSSSHFPAVTASIASGSDIAPHLKQLGTSLFDEVFTTLLPNINQAVIITDAEKRILVMNSAAENLLECTLQTAKGKLLAELLRLYDTCGNEDFLVSSATEERKRQGKLAYHDLILKTTPNCYKRITLSVLPLENGTKIVRGYVFLLSDNTLNYKIEEELFKAYRLDSTKPFIGGIVHDFNNILSAIMGNVSLVKHCLSSFPISADNLCNKLDMAEKACERARHLSSQLMNYSKTSSEHKETVDLKDIVEETVKFVCHGSSYHYIFNFAEDSPKVRVDLSRISQVINNLVLNALQAMPEGGMLSITSEQCSLSPGCITSLEKSKLPSGRNRKASADNLESKRFLKLGISDTGSGIPQEYTDKIFEPFFTGKENGTGLGLTSCKRIVSEHGGYIAFRSKQGVGTTFFIFLPVASESDDEIAELHPDEEEITCGNGRILILDDDQDVKQVTANILNELGYEVDLASTETEVIELYRQGLQAKKKYEAVIIDLTIAGKQTGIDTLHKLLSLDGNVRAILTTGSSNDNWIDKYKELGFKAFLSKPFSIRNLVQILKEI